MLSAQLLREADGQQSARRSLSVGAGMPSINGTAVSLSTTKPAAVGIPDVLHINLPVCGQLPSLCCTQQGVVGGDPLQLQLMCARCCCCCLT